jgi:lipoate-protein ligase B
MDYDSAWALQRELRDRRITGEGHDVLLTLEHDPPVFTAGRRAHEENLRLPRSQLEELGFQLRAVERGGDWTFHGPGQLVGYPIVGLVDRHLKVTGLVRGLEAAMADVVRACLARAGVDPEAAGLTLGQLKGLPGCWLFRPDGSRAKVGAVGVYIRRFVSLHGLALNLDPRPWGFGRIVPCGLQDEVTSVARLIDELGGDPRALPSMEEAAGLLAAALPPAWAAWTSP